MKNKYLSYYLVICMWLIFVQNDYQRVKAQSLNDIRDMNLAKLPIIYPKYIPNNFRLTNFKSNIGKDEGYKVKSAFYKATYHGPNKYYFFYEACNSCGWGDQLDIRQEWLISSALMGKIKLMHIVFGNNKNLLESWIFGKRGKGELFKYVPNGRIPPRYNIRFEFHCANDNKLFNPREAIKIIKSMSLK